MPQNQQLGTFQFCQRHRLAVGIEKFHLEHARSKDVNNRADLPGDQTFRRLVVKQRHDIQQFDRCVLHTVFMAQNR